MYKLLNIIKKSEFMDINILQCNTAVAERAIALHWPIDQNAQ